MKKIKTLNDQGEKMTVKIGSIVCFKSDDIQYGKVVKIKVNSWGDVTLKVKADGKFTGHYIGGKKKVTINANDCFLA